MKRLSVTLFYCNELDLLYGAPLKTGLRRQNRHDASAARKADEARLYALWGGLTTQTACTVDFDSNKVFRGALWSMQP